MLGTNHAGQCRLIWVVLNLAGWFHCPGKPHGMMVRGSSTFIFELSRELKKTEIVVYRRLHACTGSGGAGGRKDQSRFRESGWAFCGAVIPFLDRRRPLLISNVDKHAAPQTRPRIRSAVRYFKGVQSVVIGTANRTTPCRLASPLSRAKPHDQNLGGYRVS